MCIAGINVFLLTSSYFYDWPVTCMLPISNGHLEEAQKFPSGQRLSINLNTFKLSQRFTDWVNYFGRFHSSLLVILVEKVRLRSVEDILTH